mgnify:CR=1 FL=1
MAQTIKLRRSSTEGKVPTTAQLSLGELAINTYDGRIFFEKNDGSATIEHIVTTDSITTGSITLTGKVTTGTLTLSGLSAQNSEATALMINGSNVVGTRELGSNAFTSTTIGTTTNALTDGTGIADFSFDGSGAVSIATDDSAIVHDNLSGFVANEHIDHSSVSITAGTGLNGGGNITTTRTLNVDSDYKNDSLNAFTASNANTSLNAATSSYLTTVDISSDTNLAVSDTSEVNMILSGDTLSAELIGGVVSGSSQISIGSTTGTLAVNKGGTGATTAAGARSNLGVDAAGTDNSTDVTLAGSYDYITISGQTITRNQITNDDLAGSIANGKLANSGIGIGNAGTIDLGESATVANILKGSGMVSGSSQVLGILTSLNSATGSYLTAHPNISAGSNISQNNSNGTVLQDLTITLDSNGHVTTATAGTVNLDGRYYTETESDTLFTKKLGQGIISGAAQLNSTEINTLDVAGTLTAVGAFAADDSVTLSGLATQGSETDVLTINGSNLVGTRQLGSNAFNSTSFGTGSVTSVTVGTGLDVSTATTVPNITLDLSELTDMTAAVVGTQDELILLDNGAERRKLISEITLSDFNNDSGFLTTVDISSDTNLAVSDTSEVNMILSGDTLSAELIGGVVSGSSQVLGILTSLNAATSSYATGDNFDEDGTFSSLRAQGTTASDVGLGNVTNQSKSTMFTSPTFTGTPISTTPSANDNSTKIATTAYVQTELTDLVGNAPAAFDTLGEISASLAADSGALDSLTTVVSGKLQKNQNLSDLTNVEDARTNLGVDASGTDNSTNVTLAGSRNYITISGQTITRNVVDISDDTNLAVSDTDNVDMILSGDTLSANLKGGVISGSAQLANSAISNESLNAATSSYLTSHPSISQGSNISQNNSSGTVIQDLTITLDSNGHVTTATAGTVNLDGRYYTETESDTLFTKKLGQGIISGAAQITAFGTLEIGNPTVTGTLLSEDVVQFTGLSAQSSEATSLMINGSGIVGTRELGSNAFNSTSFLTEHPNISAASSVDNSNGSVIQDVTLDSNGHVTGLASANLDGRYYTETEIDNFGFGTGSVTNVTVGTGLDISLGTTTPAISLDLTEITLGAGLDSTATGLSLDLSELTDMTAGVNGSQDELILLDNGAERRKAINEIDLAQFDNTSAGFISSFDITTQTDSKYLRSNANDTASGIITLSNSTASTNKTTGALVVTGGVGISGALNVGGDVTAFASSDERYKDNVTPIENPNEKIKLLSGNTFVWNDKHEIYKGKKDIGVIAQEVEKVLPEIVETRENGYKAVKYEKIVALLIESNKELIKRVEELESKIK